mgnify:CR=1 FL=1
MKYKTTGFESMPRSKPKQPYESAKLAIYAFGNRDVICSSTLVNLGVKDQGTGDTVGKDFDSWNSDI